MSLSEPNTKVHVGRVNVKDDLIKDIDRAVELIGGFKGLIDPNDKILIKANLNSPDKYPASSDLNFIKAVVELLKNHGSANITIGASSGLAWHPTSKVLKKKKLPRLADELGVRLVNFDEGEWTKIDIKGQYLKEVHIAKEAIEADKLIYLPNMKTHALARFSMGIKFAVGLTRPDTRYFLHKGNLEEKVAEINLAVKPDLILLDARKCMVTRGPAKGRRKKPGYIFACTDMVALDVEALKVLKSFKAKNRLNMPIWDLPQIAAARKLKLGVQTEADYTLLIG
ncbi:MAG: DUF362 domain-containing protein [Deltaproteobacteria bacterium]|nr:DUF362 domain-containing protein [Deltaproteobacteria bacterium]MBW1985163.1 DUF362 domain-containing protein [Deltaproteobacteria bacterium]